MEATKTLKKLQDKWATAATIIITPKTMAAVNNYFGILVESYFGLIEYSLDSRDTSDLSWMAWSYKHAILGPANAVYSQTKSSFKSYLWNLLTVLTLFWLDPHSKTISHLKTFFRVL